MAKHFSVLICSIILLSLNFSSCSNNQIAGTGTDTSTKDVYASISGTILDVNHEPAQNCVVYLLPCDYNPVNDKSPDSISIDTTNSNGQYLVSTGNAGNYNVISISDSSRISLRLNLSLQEKKTYKIEPDSLKAGNSLEVSVHEQMRIDSGALYFEGTPFYALISSSQVIFPILPSITTPLYYTSKDTAHNPILVSDSISTVSGKKMELFNALLIMENVTDANNILIIKHVAQIGGIVTTAEVASLSSYNTSLFSVIIICPSVQNSDAELLDSMIQAPVIVCKHQFFGKMGLTGPKSGTDFGSADSQEAIVIVNTTNPVTNGFSGIVNVYTKLKTLNWGISDSATVLAKSNDSLALPVLFCYEKGQLMYSFRAPARRVGFFIESNPSISCLNDNGWLLFEQSILWAIDN